MKLWIRFGVPVAAVAIIAAAATAVVAMGSDGDRERESPGVAVDERTDDTGGGGGVAAVCIEGTVDCVDTIVDPQTAPEVDCQEPADCTDVPAAGGICEAGDEACTLEEDFARRCDEIAEAGREPAECSGTPGCDPAGAECLPPDCAISSDGAVSCPEPHTGEGGSGGAQSAPGIPGEAEPDGGAGSNAGVEPPDAQ